MEEVELLTLLADHPDLIASTDADKAFWLLTDERLRAMYSAARAGQPLSELLPTLASKTIKVVLSEKKTDANPKDPIIRLAGMVANLENRKDRMSRTALLEELRTAHRTGDRELVARITAQISSNRKQVD